MVIIYSPTSSVRFTYSVNLLFRLMPGLNYEITNNTDNFLNNNDARINYSNQHFEGAVNIRPCGLLAETGITAQKTTIGNWQGVPTLFQLEGDVPFDIFSAVFYLATRYEEYTDKTRDQHGRYTAAQSLAHKNGFLALPLINIWANQLRLLLNARFNLSIQKAPYTFTPTLDIDQAYYYHHKPFVRNILGFARQVYKGQWTGAAKRAKVMLGLQQDPNDTFQYQTKTHKQYGVQATYFFHVGDAGPHDPYPLYHLPAVSSIIQSLSSTNLVGIHPSYRSFNNKDIILAEKLRLEKITHTVITHSRQHFLRFDLPQTYRTLIGCGITDDYSMGYADVAGYRAGIAAPYKWFDLEKNEETTLTLHPFAVMDVTLKNYMLLTPQAAIDKINELNNPVKQNGGHFMSLWHNESLGYLPEWKGWQRVYQHLLSTCIPDNED
jgi:hypothetical protein